MLTSILPGAREIRTPLACGYVWLVAAWLVFADHLPRTQPSVGIVASFWYLGGLVGKTAVLAAVTFAAYLIGAVLEVDPTQLWGPRGIPSVPPALVAYRPAHVSIESMLEKDQPQSNRTDAASDNVEADVLNEEGRETNPTGDTAEGAADTEIEAQRVERFVESFREDVSRSFEAMQAFATALQARNTELFGRYDRLETEASLRLNIAAPLVILLELLIWRSPLLLWIKLPLSLVPVVLAATLLRQSLLRVKAANQVLIMAEIVGILDEKASD